MKRSFIVLSTPMILGLGLVLGLLLLSASRSEETLARPADAFTTPVSIITVCPQGPPTCDHELVQNAVDAASNGDMIKIASGVYTDVHARAAPDGYPGPQVITQVVYISKPLSLLGGYDITFADPPDPVANPTTLNAQGQGRVGFIAGLISVTLEGLHITGGNALGLQGSEGGDVGGGLYVLNTALTLSNNWILSNTVATHGGGLYLYGSSAAITGNTLSANDAGSFGGGIYLSSSNATITGNKFFDNICWRGGGLTMAYSSAAILGNTFIDNFGGHDAGAIHLTQSTATIEDNIIQSNYSTLGGGIRLNLSQATLHRNIISDNTAFQWGGAMYITQSEASMIDNTITQNGVISYGGGLFLSGSDVSMVNTVLADNYVQAGSGSGIYLSSSSLRMQHSTIVHNYGGDGNGLYLLGSESTASLTNTILVEHDIGIIATISSTAGLEATMWDNEIDWINEGNLYTGTINLWGNPIFKDPTIGDYHILPTSPVIDAGVDTGVKSDIDGDPRPIGLGYDLGADEHPIVFSVNKNDYPDPVIPGAVLTYTLWLTNSGLMDINAIISDVLPAQVIPSGILSWTAQISPGEVWTQEFNVDIQSGYTGVMTNTLQVVTQQGAEAACVITTTVSDVPIAGLSATNDGPTPLGDPTTFTATLTAGSNLSFVWDFGDGASGYGAVVTHTYTAVDLYGAMVSATNSLGSEVARTSVSVFVPKRPLFLPLVAKKSTD